MFEVSSLFLDNLHLVCRFGKVYGPPRVSTGGMMRLDQVGDVKQFCL